MTRKPATALHAVLCAGLCLGGLAWPAGGAWAQAPSAQPPNASPNASPSAPQPAPVPTDPALEAAKRAYEALPEGDRKAVQDGLVWTGEYNGAVDGNFGRRTYEAIIAFQKRMKNNPDGILDGRARLSLLETEAKAKIMADFRQVQDERNGLRVSLPLKILERRTLTPNGTIFRAKDDSIVLETRQYTEGQTTLEQLFDRLRAEGPGRIISYKVLRPDWFVIAGEDRGRRLYMRYAKAPGPDGKLLLRGFVLSYATTQAPTFDRLAIAIANSFEPFPTGPMLTPGSGPIAASANAAPPPRTPLAGSGIVVAPGRVLTAAAAATACSAPTIGGQPTKVAKLDQASGLALLDAAGAKAQPIGLAFPEKTVAPSDSIVALSFSVPESGDPVSAVAAGEATKADDPKSGRWRALVPLQGAAAGAALFDRGGRLAGLVADAQQQPRLVAGAVPALSYAAIPASAIEPFLKAADIQPASGGNGSNGRTLSAGEIVVHAGGAMVAVMCPR